MFEIRKHIELDAGHRVPHHASKCRNIHGHRYRVTAIVRGEDTIAPETGRSDAGMLVDFGDIKKVLMEKVHDPYDHRLILWEKDKLVPILQEMGPAWGMVTVPCIPTAEELARFWGRAIFDALSIDGMWLHAIEVRETPTSFATYTF